MMERIVDIVGNLNMDLILRGIPGMPAWGREVFGNDCLLVPSGQAGYTALALGAVGVPVRVHSVLGGDPWGDTILAALSGSGADVRGIERAAGTRTGLSVALVRGDGERAFASYYGSLAAFDAQALGRLRPGIRGRGALLVCGINALPNLPLDAVEEICRDYRGSGGLTALDTGWDPLGWGPERLAGLRRLLREISVFIPNEEEARAMTGFEEPEEQAKALLGFGAGLVVIKLGPRGCYAAGGGSAERLPAFPAEVLDAVGAGDVFNAGFLAATLSGRSLRERMAYGSAAASIYISRAENRYPSARETAAVAESLGAPGAVKEGT